MSRKVAIVTGANKGIGFAIVKGLCQRYDGDVYLTARDETRGQEAVAKLDELGLKPFFHQLDISDVASVQRLHDHIKQKHGGIDILINNAAIAFKRNSTENFGVQAEKTTFVNYFSVLSTCQILFPLLRPKSRVINVSSSQGLLSVIPGEDIRQRFANPNLTVIELSNMVREFVESAKNGTNAEKGWGSSAYAVSKVALCALTFIQHREYDSKDISVNCVHPGYVDTDMSSHRGVLSPDEGAVAPLYLAMDANDSVRGVFMNYDKTIFDWKTSKE